MKYLLSCPACGTQTPVETGQAGQILHCSCGNALDVPTIRNLHKLQPIVEEQSSAPQWTRRQGTVFLGGAVAIIAIVAAACILIFRPASVDRSQLPISIDTNAIRREIDAYSPAESFARFEAVDSPMPSHISEELEKGSVPIQLLPSASLLVAFEGQGSHGLTPLEAAKVNQQLSKLGASLADREATRSATTDWLWLLAAVAMFGLGIAGSTLLVRPERTNRPRTSPRSVPNSSSVSKAGKRD